MVFFPTQKETFLGFLIQGPYRTTPARDNVPGDDPENQALVRETAALIVDVLRELRASGLLTVEVLAALPLDAARFPPGSMLRPLFDAVRTALTGEELIPAAGGGFAAARNLKLASPAELRELLDPGQLTALFQADVSRSPSPSFPGAGPVPPLLRHYLREEIGVGEVTPEDLLAAATRSFLEAQPDDWITRFYGFLHADPALWREPRIPGDPPGPARTRPIIRLEDGRQAEPFDAAAGPRPTCPRATSRAGRDRASPPCGGRSRMTRRPGRSWRRWSSPSRTSWPRSWRSSCPGTRGWRSAPPRPQTRAPAGTGRPAWPPWTGRSTPRTSTASCGRWTRRTPGAAPELLEQLRQTAFLIGENAASGDLRLMPPGALYQRTRDLEIYLDGNPDAWFAADTYGPWVVQLRVHGGSRPGGRAGPRAGTARARSSSSPGSPGTSAAWTASTRRRGSTGWSSRWRTRATPAPSTYGTSCSRRTGGSLPGWSRSRCVSSSPTPRGRRSGRRPARPRRAKPGCPGRTGLFHRPADLSLDDLPPTFARDEGLAQALGMSQPVVSQAARRLGIPPEVLWGLSAHPDLVAMIERELKLRAAGGRPAGTTRDVTRRRRGRLSAAPPPAAPRR